LTSRYLSWHQVNGSERLSSSAQVSSRGGGGRRVAATPCIYT
jgi:hypothetical protein